MSILVPKRVEVNRPRFEVPGDFCDSRQGATLLAVPFEEFEAMERTGGDLPMPIANVGFPIYWRTELLAWDWSGWPAMAAWHAIGPKRPTLHAEDVKTLGRLFGAEGGVA